MISQHKHELCKSGITSVKISVSIHLPKICQHILCLNWPDQSSLEKTTLNVTNGVQVFIDKVDNMLPNMGMIQCIL